MRKMFRTFLLVQFILALTAFGFTVDTVNAEAVIQEGVIKFRCPPDTHGAVGLDYFVEVTNSHVDVYQKSEGTRVKSVSLASFFGYTKQTLFDPRCVL